MLTHKTQRDETIPLTADTMRNEDLLMQGIILQTVSDYRRARRRLMKNPHDKSVQRTVAELAQCFRSKWFGKLTTLDPEVLIDKLEREA